MMHEVWSKERTFTDAPGLTWFLTWLGSLDVQRKEVGGFDQRKNWTEEPQITTDAPVGVVAFTWYGRQYRYRLENVRLYIKYLHQK